jgi:hypothetical protein
MAVPVVFRTVPKATVFVAAVAAGTMVKGAVVTGVPPTLKSVRVPDILRSVVFLSE